MIKHVTATSWIGPEHGSFVNPFCTQMIMILFSLYNTFALSTTGQIWFCLVYYESYRRGLVMNPRHAESKARPQKFHI